MVDWVRLASEVTKGQLVSIHGKTVRRSHERFIGWSAIHMVSAWASDNHLALGQTGVDDRSNKITAIPELLRVREVSGCIVTIDAMECRWRLQLTGESVASKRKRVGRDSRYLPRCSLNKMRLP